MQCYLCGHAKSRVVSEKLRYGEPRKVLQCERCGLVVLEPQTESPQEYYREDYRKVYTPIVGEQVTSRQIFDMYLPFQQRRVEELRPFLNPTMRVLEVGCSAGHFLYAIKGFVKECVGIEFNENDARFVNQELGIKVHTSPIEETGLPEQHFDLIAVLQVLEHMEDPLGFLGTVSRYLKRGGYLCVEVPNVDEALLTVYDVPGYRTFYYKPPHIFYYSPKTLRMLLEKAGFRGEMKSVQRYNFVNHMNWVLTGKPQKRADVAMSTPVLVGADAASRAVKDELNQWFQRLDEEYKAILNKHQLGESVLFLGKNYGS